MNPKLSHLYRDSDHPLSFCVRYFKANMNSDECDKIENID